MDRRRAFRREALRRSRTFSYKLKVRVPVDPATENEARAATRNAVKGAT